MKFSSLIALCYSVDLALDYTFHKVYPFHPAVAGLFAGASIAIYHQFSWQMTKLALIRSSALGLAMGIAQAGILSYQGQWDSYELKYNAIKDTK